MWRFRKPGGGEGGLVGGWLEWREEREEGEGRGWGRTTHSYAGVGVEGLGERCSVCWSIWGGRVIWWCTQAFSRCGTSVDASDS